jgi:hypothetical protein
MQKQNYFYGSGYNEVIVRWTRIEYITSGLEFVGADRPTVNTANNVLRVLKEEYSNVYSGNPQLQMYEYALMHIAAIYVSETLELKDREQQACMSDQTKDGLTQSYFLRRGGRKAPGTSSLAGFSLPVPGK